MYAVVVRMSVHPDKLETFLAGMRANSRTARADETGCLRFDVHQLEDQPTEFLLYEVYASRQAFHDEHRSAPGYLAWRRVAAECVVEGSHHNIFATPVFPEDLPENPAPRPPAGEGTLA